MNSHRKNRRVIVSMSGGVDSSTATVLLRRFGYEVIGITMKLWEYSDVGGNDPYEGRACCNEGAHRAKEVCSLLNIPHYTLDHKENFRHRVIANFIDEYLRGRTPNPCVLCNMTVRWDTLYTMAQKLNSDFYATGHYARIRFDFERKRYILSRGIDKKKDQSYVLWGLTQKHLSRTLFPLGGFLKSEIRDIAARHNLPAANLPESQEICFIADDDYGRFLGEQVKGLKRQVANGSIIDSDGNRIGAHRGYPFYTIGQRKGLGIALGKPVYVYDIDPETNTIYVGNETKVYSQGLEACQVNWVSMAKPDCPIRANVMVRYNDHGCAGTIYPEGDDRVRIIFDEPRKAVTPGQSAVWYQGNDLIGGGIIDKKLITAQVQNYKGEKIGAKAQRHKGLK